MKINVQLLVFHVYLSIIIGSIVAAWAAFQIVQETKRENHLKEVQKVKKYKWSFEFENGGGFAIGCGVAKGLFDGEIDFALLLGFHMVTLSRKVVPDA